MFLDRLILFFRSIKNIILFFILSAFLLSILSNVVSPLTTYLIAPFGLLFIPLFIVTLAVFILYIRRTKWIAIAAFLLLIFSFQFLPNTFSFSKEQGQGKLKIMTWNVKNFDLYNWTKNKGTRQQMLNLIETTNADILCLQEYFTNEFEYNNTESMTRLGYKYHSFIPSYSQLNTGNQWGLAIFSKYPISNEELLHINPNKSSMNQCLKADVKFKGKVYHIFNAHLQSIHLDYQDYDYIKDVKTKWKMIDYFKSYQIISKLLHAYQNRIKQIDNILAELPTESMAKTILCCDMNDIPNSYAYHQISSILNDTYKHKGKHFSNTISMPLPIYRIDYIFTSDNVLVQSYRRQKTNLSDHHFLVCTLD
jgi:endonuclease/exonuclease/phosphatase family metal-dependent hydrolase